MLIFPKFLSAFLPHYILLTTDYLTPRPFPYYCLLTTVYIRFPSVPNPLTRELR